MEGKSMHKNVKKPKDTWLDEGLTILEESGPSSLTIDNLVLRIGKTKGSFYHHFKNRNTYIEAILAHYEAKVTLEILHEVNKSSGKIERLKKLTELVFQISSKLELVIRAWSLYEPLVKKIQDRIDQKRLDHLKSIYLSSCVDEAEAETMALRNYSIYIGLQQLKHIYGTNNFKKLLKDIFITSHRF